MSREMPEDELATAVLAAGQMIRDAICHPSLPADGVDGTGKVSNLTEGSIDIAHGLKLVAEAIRDLADAVRESQVTNPVSLGPGSRARYSSRRWTRQRS